MFWVILNKEAPPHPNIHGSLTRPPLNYAFKNTGQWEQLWAGMPGENVQHLSSLFVNDAHVHNADLMCLLSKTLAQASVDPTHEYTETNRGCCLSPCPAALCPVLFMGREWLLRASSESADLPWSMTAFAVPFPVRALNPTWREPFGHREVRELCIWMSACLGPLGELTASVTVKVLLGPTGVLWQPLTEEVMSVRQSVTSLLPLQCCQNVFICRFSQFILLYNSENLSKY